MAPRKVKGVLAESRKDLRSMEERLKLFSKDGSTLDGTDDAVTDVDALAASSAGAASSSAAAASSAA